MRRRTLSIDGWISLSTISIDLQDSMVSTATASVIGDGDGRRCCGCGCGCGCG